MPARALTCRPCRPHGVRRIAKSEMAYDYAHVSALSAQLVDSITSRLEHVIRNGDPVRGYPGAARSNLAAAGALVSIGPQPPRTRRLLRGPGCVNLSFAYVEGESLLMALKNVALSSGSACTSASLEPSYVLRAVGADEDLAHSSIRCVAWDARTRQRRRHHILPAHPSRPLRLAAGLALADSQRRLR